MTASFPEPSLTPCPETPFPLLKFPMELLLIIAKLLPTRQLSLLSRTCRTLHHALSPLLQVDFERQAPSISLFATKRNDPALLSRALAFYNPGRERDGYYLLQYACMERFEQILRLLLQHNAPIRPMSLFRALTRADIGIARLLLENGAGWYKWEMRDPSKDDEDLTEVERLLLECGGRRDANVGIVRDSLKVSNRRGGGALHESI